VNEQQLAAGLGLTRAIGSLAPDTGTFLAAQTGTAGPDANIAAFPALETDVAQYDRVHPNALVPVYPEGPPYVADYPYSMLSAVGPTASATAGTTLGGSSLAAADQFGQFLLTAPAQAALAKVGLRRPDGTIAPDSLLSGQHGFSPEVATYRPLPDAQALSRIVAEWANLQRRVDLLALLDTSGSMLTSLPGTPQTRLALLQQTAGTGFGYLPNTMRIGLWEFSHRDGDPREYRELVPYGPIIGTVNGIPRSQALAQAVPQLRAAGGTPLYDTTYAAFHYMQGQWTAGSTNSVLLITDGFNEVAGGLTLQELVKRLKAEQKPDQPVQIVSIGIGKEADAAALNQISTATGGRTFLANDAATAIQTLILAFTGRLQ
jgi:Ca-activated chloride channel family protein